MHPIDPKDPSLNGRRRRSWIAVAIAVVVLVAVAIASGAFGDFTRGVRDGYNGQTRTGPAGPR